MKPIVSSDKQSYSWYISYSELSEKKRRRFFGTIDFQLCLIYAIRRTQENQEEEFY